MRPVILNLLMCTFFLIPAMTVADNLEEKLLNALMITAIQSMDSMQAKQSISELSRKIKDPMVFEWLTQRIDKYTFKNPQFEEQGELLKEILTESRNFYLRQEQKALDSYENLKKETYKKKEQLENLEKQKKIEESVIKV